MPSTTSLPTSGEQTITLEHRFVYGRGTVKVCATLDESGVLLISEHAGDQTRIIPITTRDGQERLREVLAYPTETSVLTE